VEASLIDLANQAGLLQHSRNTAPLFASLPLPHVQVQSVILLVRRRGAHTAHERVCKLLCSPLFHVLHEQAAAGGFNPFAKVRVIEGDLDHPGLGLSESDRQLVVSQVDFILHCAADLALESHIQRTLR
jgi:thioester reductase-like protein